MANHRDDGFTLVESVVSLFICAVIITAAAGAALTSVKGSLAARANQQAGNILTEEVERIRGYDYAATTMVQSDLAGDAAINGTGPYTYKGAPLVVDSVGLVNPHRSTVTRNNIEYFISRYVTDASDARGSYKQLSVVVEWSLHGTLKTKTASTLLTDVRRGLPLPKFNFVLNGPSTPQTVGAGDRLTWGFSVENLGARDVWNVGHDGAATWAYYVDADGDGILDATETTPLADADGNGVRDTGTIETNDKVYFLATRITTASEFTPGTTSFTAASASQPPPASEAKVVPATVHLTASSGGGAACPSGVACTLVTRGFGQQAEGASTTGNPMPMSASNVLQPSAFDYSTELGANVSGRMLQKGASGSSEQDLYQVADFRYQVPQGQAVAANGTAGMQLYVRCLVPGATYTLTAFVGTATNSNMNNFTSAGSGSATVTSCDATGLTLVGLSIPVSSFSTSKYVVARVTLSSDATTDVRLMYDSAAAPAALILPEV